MCRLCSMCPGARLSEPVAGARSRTGQPASRCGPPNGSESISGDLISAVDATNPVRQSPWEACATIALPGGIDHHPTGKPPTAPGRGTVGGFSLKGGGACPAPGCCAARASRPTSGKVLPAFLDEVFQIFHDLCRDYGRRIGGRVVERFALDR